MSSDDSEQQIIVQDSQSYAIDWADRIKYIKEHCMSYAQQDFDAFDRNIRQEVQNENCHHPCLSIDLGQEYDEQKKPRTKEAKAFKPILGFCKVHKKSEMLVCHFVFD